MPRSRSAPARQASARATADRLVLMIDAEAPLLVITAPRKVRGNRSTAGMGGGSPSRGVPSGDDRRIGGAVTRQPHGRVVDGEGAGGSRLGRAVGPDVHPDATEEREAG